MKAHPRAWERTWGVISSFRKKVRPTLHLGNGCQQPSVSGDDIRLHYDLLRSEPLSCAPEAPGLYQEEPFSARSPHGDFCVPLSPETKPSGPAGALLTWLLWKPESVSSPGGVISLYVETR